MSRFAYQLAPLDQALVERGYQRVASLGGAAWEGIHGGRACRVTAAPQGRTYYAGEVRVRRHLGYRLRIELATSLRTQLFFVSPAVANNAVVRLIYRWKRQAVLPPPEEFADFRAVTPDPTWSARLLAERTVMASVAALVRANATPTFAGSVYASPTSTTGKLYYGSPNLGLADLTAERVFWVLGHLAWIAHGAEALPAPTVDCSPGWLGRASERHPILVAAGLFGCALAGLGLAAFMVVMIAALLTR